MTCHNRRGRSDRCTRGEAPAALAGFEDAGRAGRRGDQRPLEAGKCKVCPEGTQPPRTVLDAAELFTLK